MSQDGRHFLDSQAEESGASQSGSQQSDVGSNNWDLNDSFINDSHVTESQYTTSESEYSGWSSGTSQADSWYPSQSTPYPSSSQGTIVIGTPPPSYSQCNGSQYDYSQGYSGSPYQQSQQSVEYCSLYSNQQDNYDSYNDYSTNNNQQDNYTSYNDYSNNNADHVDSSQLNSTLTYNILEGTEQDNDEIPSGQRN